MKEKILLKKICSIYASDIHFATVIFPFLHRELKENTEIKTILEKNMQKNIEKVLENVGLNSEIKDKVRKIDWECTSIEKIRENFKVLEKEIKENKKIDIIIAGENQFIDKVNKAIDLWAKNHIEILEKTNQSISIINCFSYGENAQIEKILHSHEYILKTAGIEEIEEKEDLLKAN